MTKDRRPIGVVIRPEELVGLLGGQQVQLSSEPTPEERHRQAREALETAVKGAFHGCSDPHHERAHGALRELLSTLWNVASLPERIQQPFLRLVADLALHRDRPLGEMLDTERIGDLFFVAAGVAAIFEHPDWLVPEANIQPSDRRNGGYL